MLCSNRHAAQRRRGPLRPHHQQPVAGRRGARRKAYRRALDYADLEQAAPHGRPLRRHRRSGPRRHLRLRPPGRSASQSQNPLTSRRADRVSTTNPTSPVSPPVLLGSSDWRRRRTPRAVAANSFIFYRPQTSSSCSPPPLRWAGRCAASAACWASSSIQTSSRPRSFPRLGRLGASTGSNSPRHSRAASPGIRAASRNPATRHHAPTRPTTPNLRPSSNTFCARAACAQPVRSPLPTPPARYPKSARAAACRPTQTRPLSRLPRTVSNQPKSATLSRDNLVPVPTLYRMRINLNRPLREDRSHIAAPGAVISPEPRLGLCRAAGHNFLERLKINTLVASRCIEPPPRA
jgi:hypothetical protein